MPYLVPAADLLPYWPHDLLATCVVGMLGRLTQLTDVTELELVGYEGDLGLRGTLAPWDEPALDLPLVDGVQLVLSQTGSGPTLQAFELDFGPPSGVVTGSVPEQTLDIHLKGRHAPLHEYLQAT
jgi:hypothetical protein